MANPPLLDATFEAVVFDWDGTAVPDRAADASAVRGRVEALCDAGVHVFVVSGTHVGNVDGQLGARPTGRGRLHLCCNRGSEVFEVVESGPVLVEGRQASAAEDRALDEAAERTVGALRERGIDASIVSNRLNRRKIDLIPEWTDPKKAEIDRLAEAVDARLHAAALADLAAVVELAVGRARAAGLDDPRVTSDVKHVEIGLTDKSDSARFAARWLAARGITGRLVLVAGDEFGPVGGVPGSDSYMTLGTLTRAVVVSVGIEPVGVPAGVVHLSGGPARFAEVLDEQLRRRGERRVPQIDADPGWVLVLPETVAKERVAESLGSLCNGWTGTRGSREEDGRGTVPLFQVAGVYTGDDVLLAGPVWNGLELSRAHQREGEERLVDLRTGVLFRCAPEPSKLRSVRFASAATPHVLAMRAEGRAGDVGPGEPLWPPAGAQFESWVDEGVHVARSSDSDGEIVVAATDHVVHGTARGVVERLAAWEAPAAGERGSEVVRKRLEDAASNGFDALLAEHREAWARQWADAEVAIEGDAGASADQLAARFAVFHILSAAAGDGEAAVGARGLTGTAYAGHVFWDADVFVLPALAAIRPTAARAMLEYRLRRLPAARVAARRRGLAGALFPWESAGDGTDVTPRFVLGVNGERVPIATGLHEEHIVADVAWGAAQYAAWSGDDAFCTQGAGRDLLVETARYWASRLRTDAAGIAHIYGVMGPDEYHEVVDDNAYTNVMARWNLHRGAEALAASGQPDDVAEAARWREHATRLDVGWNPERGIYEQFAGYFGLEPLLVEQVASPPVAIDVVLGADRVAGSQLIKQADVLMLHHLVPDEVVPGSLRRCLDFYEPRTAHGSSLSPAVSASLLARAGEPDRALELFRMAARLDIDDLTGTTASGLHLATMGGVWQALASGFLGLRARGDVLEIDPCLPAAWTALSLRFVFRGRRTQVRATHEEVTVGCDAPLEARIAGGVRTVCVPPMATYRLAPVPSTEKGARHD